MVKGGDIVVKGGYVVVKGNYTGWLLVVDRKSMADIGFLVPEVQVGIVLDIAGSV